jgi:hypothetical protein
MEVEIKHLDVGSVVKVAFVIYVVVGLVVGVIYMIAMVLFSGFMHSGFGAREPFIGRSVAMGLGVLLVPLMALLYGLLGALGGLIFSVLYNLISRTIGGVKVRLKGEVPGAGTVGDV